MSKHTPEKSMFTTPVDGGVQDPVIPEHEATGWIYSFVSWLLNRKSGVSATKVGYTSRSANRRSLEWKRKGGIYADIKLLGSIKSAFQTLDGDKTLHFLDHAIHRLLEIEEQFVRTASTPGIEELFPNEKLSKEFFHSLETGELIDQDYLNRILESLPKMHAEGTLERLGIKVYEDFKESVIVAAVHYIASKNFGMRKFQEMVVEKATEYYKNSTDQNKMFLIVAPTRAGKSFMAANVAYNLMEWKEQTEGSSVASASESKQNLILIVSGVADVAVEHQQAIEEHKKFNQREGTTQSGKTKMAFVTRTELADNGKQAVQNQYDAGAETVVVFLTLQDLYGSFAGLKGDHFIGHDFLLPDNEGNSPVDFLIVDEAHFAALNDKGMYRKSFVAEDSINSESDKVDNSDLTVEEAEVIKQAFASINPKMGTLMVSATPYKELLHGNTFGTDNMAIISKKQILEEAEEWLRNNSEKPEWHSPYFGMPKYHYFAIDTGVERGVSSILEATPSNQKVASFVNKDVAKSLIYNFFGYKNNDKDFSFPVVVTDPVYVAAGLGNHILITVDRKLSADAIEVEIKELKEANADFDFEIINISSSNDSDRYRKMTAAGIKSTIDKFDREGKKTITITVDRMLTGVTVKQWDTLAMWREMSSAQRWEQAAGRVGSPNVGTRKAVDSDDVVKFVQKQNVAVISYSPNQMVNVLNDGAIAVAKARKTAGEDKNLSVYDLVEEELDVIPLYQYSVKGGDAMVQVTANNILDRITEGDRERGISNAARNLVLNLTGLMADEKLLGLVESLDDSNSFVTQERFSLFDLQEQIAGQCEIVGCEKSVVRNISGSFEKFSGMYCETHLQQRVSEEIANEEAEEGKKNKETTDPLVDAGVVSPESAKEAKNSRKQLEQRIRNAAKRVVLFASLSSSTLTDVEDVVQAIRENGDDKRIAHNLDVSADFLERLVEVGVFDGGLDLAIFTMNKSFHEVDKSSDLSAVNEALQTLIEGHGKFSANEVPTPENVAQMLVDNLQITDADWKKIAQDGGSVIDNGAKSSIILLKFAQIAVENGVPEEKLNFTAVPTSGIAYEMTRKMFQFREWDTKNILFHRAISNVDMVTLVNEAVSPSESKKHTKIISEIFDKIDDKEVRADAEKYWENVVSKVDKFDYCVSNPPYQEVVEGTSAKNIYPDFILSGSRISRRSVMVHPFRAFAGAGRAKVSKKVIEAIYGDGRFRIPVTISDSKDIFPGVNIEGGIAITTFDESNRVDSNAIKEEVTVHPLMTSIVNKVLAFGEESLKSIVSSAYPKINFSVVAKNEEVQKLGTAALTTNIFDILPSIFSEEDFIGSLKVVGRSKGKRKTLHIDRDTINHSLIGKHKVLVPKSNGSKTLGSGFETAVTGNPIVADENTVGTQTFITIGGFDTEVEANNLLRYVQTKFVRALVGTLKKTQHNAAATWGNVPMQELTTTSKINWNKEVSEIDQQLYKKYDLSPEEIAFIEENIRPM